MAMVKEKFFWKGRRVTEKVYKARMNQQKAGINNRKMFSAKVSEHNLGNKCGSKCNKNKYEFEGRQLYHTKTLAQGLICKKCNAVLSLLDKSEDKTACVWNAGVGHTTLSKILAALNVPSINSKTFRSHEQEVGNIAHEMAVASCVRATNEERQLTIKNATKMQQLL
ncbi:hypothetical protein PV327_004050 [Microctonus hyperodae]|uniref:Mutator-like transposase domain-containing protein n=1 Tax=Microctonus hyperodae TaxID=165561 RepID=A0AA39G590_MICHY|nr:hypothetical protein PV327_004050 [Microctonus hyperodae]